MSFSGMTTDEIVDEIAQHLDGDYVTANEYLEVLGENPELFSEGFAGLDDAFTLSQLPGYHDNGQDVDEYLPEDLGIPNIFRVGCDYKGIKCILEEDNENVYVPSSDYCYIKCINKFLQLVGKDFKFETKYFSPFAPSLKGIKEIMVGILYKCRHNCPVKDNYAYPGKSCLPFCRKEKLEKFKQIRLPDIYKVYFDKEKDRVVTKILSKGKRVRDDYGIGLCHLGNNEYHAVLLKNINKLSIEDITFKLVYDRELRVDFTKNKKPDFRIVNPLCVIYDIETYTDNRLKEKTKIIYNRDTKSKEKIIRLEEEKHLVPYALGYIIVDLKNMKMIGEYKEIIIDNKNDNLFNKFFDELDKENLLDNTQIFAHNGGKFDNIYAKNATNVKFVSTIAKGGFIKQLTVASEIRKYKLKDTLPFVLQNLKNACNMFNTEIKKLDFDIIDKSYEWYEEYKYSKEKETDWRQYLRNDVESLACLTIKLEQAYNRFGASILWFTGLAGIAYHICNTYCDGMKKLYVPKDPSMVAFCKASIYGGRVLQWKRFYEATDDDGMISIDMNSLYPSAMWMCPFPYGEPRLIENTDYNNIKNYPHFIINATIKVPNTRYAYHPYKTDDGMLIYPANCVIKGVYNDVDIREMEKDGYEILAVEKGIYWTRSKRIFTNLIKQLYDVRNQYKKLGEDHPEYSIEYIIKIILASMYGKFNETIKQKTVFKDCIQELEKDVKGKLKACVTNLENGQVEASISLMRYLVSKPVYIGGYVTAQSRAIVNEIIRKVKPENIYYSDTDSIYIEKRILNEKKLPCSSELGGFKNDYGDNMIIRKAIFLDMKRYYLEFEDRKFNPPKITFKAKFNGLAFKSLNTIKDFIYEGIDIEYNKLDNKDQMEMTKKLYKQILSQYNQRIESPYHMINFDKKFTKGESVKINEEFIKDNLKKQKEWEQQYIRDMQMFTEFWSREKTEVFICTKQLAFQIDPYKRGNWENNEFYSIGYDKEKDNFISRYIANIGDLKSEYEKVELVTHTLYENLEAKYIGLYMNRPLVFPDNGKLKKFPILFRNKDDEKFISTLYFAYDYEEVDGKHKIIKEDILYLDHNEKELGMSVGYVINAFGRMNKFLYLDRNKLPYMSIKPLIAIKGTDENIKKYGSNFVSEYEVLDLIDKINRVAPMI